MILVRRADLSDADAVVELLVAAFADDPAWQFISGGERQRVDRALARALFESLVGGGSGWVTDDCTAAALWERRVAGVDHHGGEVWSRYRAEVGERLWRQLEIYGEELARHEPQRPYWYLSVLATHPQARRQGLATAVMSPVLAHADDAHLPCWLETASPANVEFYQGRGFTRRVGFALPDDTPVWWMGRPAPPLEPPDPRP